MIIMIKTNSYKNNLYEIIILKEFYSTVEAAKMLGLSVRTVQLWVENGTLDAWKTAGGHRRIVAKSVDDYIESHQSHAVAEHKTNAVVTNSVPISGRRVLVVEDNPTVCKFYEAAIKSWGLDIEVVVKQDAFEALLEVGRQVPDLLIADIYMPGMDGLQMIRSLYKSAMLSSDKIILISGLSDEKIEERGGIPSDVQFFTKPINVAKLKDAVTSGLGLTKNINVPVPGVGQ